MTAESSLWWTLGETEPIPMRVSGDLGSAAHSFTTAILTTCDNSSLRLRPRCQFVARTVGGSGDYYMYFNDWMDMVVIVLIATNRPTLFVITTAAASHSCSMLSALCVEYMSVLMMYAFVYIFLLSARGRKTMGWYFGPKLFDIFVEEKIVVLRTTTTTTTTTPGIITCILMIAVMVLFYASLV